MGLRKESEVFHLLMRTSLALQTLGQHLEITTGKDLVFNAHLSTCDSPGAPFSILTHLIA